MGLNILSAQFEPDFAGLDVGLCCVAEDADNGLEHFECTWRYRGRGHTFL